MTTRILLVTPSISDACAYYRSIGPLSQLPNIHISLPSGDTSWGTPLMYDVVFFQRPFNTAHLTLAKMAAATRTPIWVDFDDQVFAVPPSNPSYRTMMRNEVLDTIAQIVELADVVTLSTNTLRDAFQQQFSSHSKFITIPNAHNDTIFPPAEASPELKKIVYWRGTSTHAADLQEFAHEIIQVAQQSPEWEFVFAGFYPYMLKGEMEFQYAAGGELMAYFQFLHQLHPAVTIAPLQHNPFNLCKSNIAWLESAYFGGRAVVPNWREWRDTGPFRYSSKRAFRSQLMAALVLEEKPFETEYPLLSDVNSSRHTILDSLL